MRTFNSQSKAWTIATLILMCLSGCTSVQQQYKVPKSKLAEDTIKANNAEVVESNQSGTSKPQAMTYLNSLSIKSENTEVNQDELSISQKETISVTTENIRLMDFIHESFATLGVSYVVDDGVNSLNGSITLDTNMELSKRDYYRLVKSLLEQNGAQISYNEGVYYIHPQALLANQLFTVGVGGSVADVPQTQGKVLQIVPLQFGSNINIERMLNQLTQTKVSSDLRRNTLFVEGLRAQVLQAVDLISMLDQPANRGKYVAFQPLVYTPAEQFAEDVVRLLEAESIPASVTQLTEKNVILIPFTRIGGVAVFASSKAFAERVAFWASKLDIAPEGTDSRYFIYRPKLARAAELGASIAPLFGGTMSSQEVGNDNRDTRSAVAAKVNVDNSVANNELKLVIDERANLLIFETTGAKYQAILPLIERLDTLPRQVILEATIAEVTLTDEFKFGVEFGLTEGEGTFSTQGGLGFSTIAGGSLTFSNAINNINARALRTNSLVNVLSNPTLLVRDGISATIVVGNEIPITTSVDTNDETNVVRTNIERIQTGLTLSVTPTINTEGVVTLAIDQRISTVGQGSGANLTILNREISTEVVANRGQPIIIGGLVSENNSEGDSKVPWLGDIPVLGNLFRSKSDMAEKTELIILVTPKIITDEQQWYEIRKNMQSGLENVTF